MAKKRKKDYIFTFTIRGNLTVIGATSEEEAEEIASEFLSTLELEDHENPGKDLSIENCTFALPIDIEPLYG